MKIGNTKRRFERHIKHEKDQSDDCTKGYTGL